MCRPITFYCSYSGVSVTQEQTTVKLSAAPFYKTEKKLLEATIKKNRVVCVKKTEQRKQRKWTSWAEIVLAHSKDSSLSHSQVCWRSIKQNCNRGRLHDGKQENKLNWLWKLEEWLTFYRCDSAAEGGKKKPEDNKKCREQFKFDLVPTAESLQEDINFLKVSPWRKEETPEDWKVKSIKQNKNTKCSSFSPTKFKITHLCNYMLICA